MAQLDTELRRLGGRIEYPPTPDVAAAVRTRLAEERPRRRRLARRPVLALVAAILVAIAAALAVPSARTAILRFFHLGGVTVERVQTLPPAAERPLAAGLGRPVSSDEAERRAGFPIVLPSGERPSRFYVLDGIVGVVLRYRGEDVLLLELPGDQSGLSKKVAAAGTRVEGARVGRRPGLWIAGAPHVVLLQGRSGQVHERTRRLAGNVLVWLQSGLTLRLESELTKEEAIELARTVG